MQEVDISAKAVERLASKMDFHAMQQLELDCANTLRALSARLAEVQADRDKWFEGAGAHHVASMREAQRADQAEARYAEIVQDMIGAQGQIADAQIAQEKLAATEARLEKAREALRPFVEYVHDDYRKGNGRYVLVPAPAYGGGWIGAEDLRRASAALETKP